jgi:hypothetical protein
MMIVKNKVVISFLIVISFANILNAKIQFSHRNDPYATHQPVLYEIASNTTGPIIEFGCGHGSTDLLHEICKKNGRLLISVDDNQEWLQKFSQKYLDDGYKEDNSGWHKFFFVPGVNQEDNQNCDHWITFLDNTELLHEIHFDLCFVDQSPWQARLETIKRFRSKSKYIILHDCDFFPEYGFAGKTIIHTDYENSISGDYVFDDIIRYFKLYYPLKPWPLFSGPPTLLGSDFESNFPEINYENY